MLSGGQAFLKRLPALTREFQRTTRAVAALEFAIVLPMLLALLFGGIEVLRYMNISKRAQSATFDLAQMLSVNGATLSGATLWKMYQAVPILIPDVTVDATMGKRKWFDQSRMNVSFIVMRKTNAACVANCQIKADVAWGYGYSKRTCGSLSPSDLDDAYQGGALPREFLGAALNLISVEIEYIYQPLFFRGIYNVINLKSRRDFMRTYRASYIVPRFIDRIDLVKLGSDDNRLGRICRGV